ncbi:hypothetical protein [Marinobacterium sp. xm-g-59]|uniref:hypothetical protein n=1 Tax=Marinobacterium sp. xm-g-59 TaxID=2497748 RepID=UPI001569138E|nr:hypothetical protein [Marinobacterium sp. xm-g-59]
MPDKARQLRPVKAKAAVPLINGRFLKGPIPLNWLTAAAKLPGKTLEVSCAIWFLVAVNKSQCVKLSNKLLKEFGVDRYAKNRALQRLEERGLITLVQKTGCSPEISVLECIDDG